jgi:RND family efflux transporter MFP subunit
MTHRHFFSWTRNPKLVVAVGCFCLTVLTVAAAPAQGPLVVSVSNPVQRSVTDYADYTGRTQAIDSVTIQARVSGYLTKVSFKEGANVKKGDILFEIDPRPYEAQYMAAKASVAVNLADLKYKRATYLRYKELKQKNPGTVGERELDQYQAMEEQANANLGLAKAKLEEARLNVEYTRVRSPIDGKIGKASVTQGNLVRRDRTRLATVVSLDPMDVSFQVDEATLLKIQQLIKAGKMKASEDGQFPVALGLANEKGFPHKGIINFVDNHIDPSTSTIKMRAAFSNKAAGGLLLPGLSVRVRLPLGTPYKALLVNAKTIHTNKSQNFVYVVDAENKVEIRPVTTGPLQPDGLRVISKGLAPEDAIIVSAPKEMKAGVQVQKKLVAMPVQASVP